ncbi:MAG: hypothetical protein LBL34_00545 [Clostridiales bacterium]|jgi:hypothetical protein|nr:hypothetical protein [Clostridiales bacterium]
MTIEEIKAIAKERYGKELTDEEAGMHLEDINLRREHEELQDADMGLEGSCGTPSDDRDPPSPPAGLVRYIKLRCGDCGFVAHMQIKWEVYKTIKSGGNVMRVLEKSGTWEASGYHDICAYGERTVDLSETDIDEGADVWLKAYVCGGYDRIAKERFTYSKSDSDTAKYKIHGTICYNYLDRE